MTKVQRLIRVGMVGEVIDPYNRFSALGLDAQETVNLAGYLRSL